MAPVVAAALIGAGATIGKGIYDTVSSGREASRERAAKEKARREANAQLGTWEAEANRILDEAQGNVVPLTSASDLLTYKDLRSSYDPEDYVVNARQFDKSQYNVEDYLNPQREAILQDVAKGIQHTAAGAGLGHSSGAVSAITRGIVDKDESLYDKAYDRMLGERNFDYGAYTDYINQQQQQLNALQQGRLAQMEQLRGDLTFDQQQQDALLASRLNLGNTLAQSRAQLI